ncbi:MAG: hypothetical protein IJ452_06710 [Butyricicoccus sp.]|nr:hypothetical protein [Butyricicoccus sp.]MBQ8585955.1 hypothetical protein [Butyricicoccus sp.]
MNYKKICRRIAKKYGVSEEEVRCEMQRALENAAALPEELVRKGSRVTAKEFIAYAAKQIKMK